MSVLRTGDFECHSRINTVLIFDDIFICLVNTVKFSAVAVNFFGNERQAVVFFNSVIFVTDFDVLIGCISSERSIFGISCSNCIVI